MVCPRAQDKNATPAMSTAATIDKMAVAPDFGKKTPLELRVFLEVFMICLPFFTAGKSTIRDAISNNVYFCQTAALCVRMM